MLRVKELCRKLQPVLGQKVAGWWAAYLAETEPAGRAEIEQTLELLAQKHLGADYLPEANPFPPPPKAVAGAGDIPLGQITYAGRQLYPFRLKSRRLTEHLLVCGRSGSGKTQLTFHLMDGLITHGIKILALDWKRGYRDLLGLYPELRVLTIGREIAPLRFNPLIPPAGCEPSVWAKLVVDIVAGSYLGGEGVISLLLAGLDHLYRMAGVYEQLVTAWPTFADLLLWLQQTKLRGRPALWQDSARRILTALTYGPFGAVLHTQRNDQAAGLLAHNVVLEMDGLSANSDRKLFSEALTLYLYRLRLAQGPQPRLTNMIVLEEAHHLLLKKAAEAKESVLENTIRMIRQYGLGYVFVDQSASSLSPVAFANSYATIALNQKLKSDVQAMSGSMHLAEEQKHILTALPLGTALVRLADVPAPFLINVPLSPVKEGAVSDEQVRRQYRSCYGDSPGNRAPPAVKPALPAVPVPDKNTGITGHQGNKASHPPAPVNDDDLAINESVLETARPGKRISRETVRFLADITTHPLSTTVNRYQRLHLSRRRGNALRQDLLGAGLLAPVTIATRSGQVVLYELTGAGRRVCTYLHLEPGPAPRASLVHRYWTERAKAYFEDKGYELQAEHPVADNGFVDLRAERPGETLAIEIETGKSDIANNLRKLREADFDKIILVATSAAAVTACSRARDQLERGRDKVELLSWLDLG